MEYYVDILTSKVMPFVLTELQNAETVDVFTKRELYGGEGFIGGVMPGIVTVDGKPAQRQIEVRVRKERKLIDVVWSKPNGTYMIDDLDEKTEYDLIARDHERVYQDVIIPAVYPWRHIFSNVSEIPQYIRKGQSAQVRFSGGALPFIENATSKPGGLRTSFNGMYWNIEASDETDTGTFEGSITDITASRSVPFKIAIPSDEAAIAWRINIGSTVNHASLNELEFAEEEGGPNICVGGTPEASSTWPSAGHEAKNAFDGITNNSEIGGVWASEFSDYGWLAYHLPVPKEVKEVRIYPRIGTYGQRIDSFYIEKLTGSGEWVRICDYSNYGETTWTEGVPKVFKVGPNIVRAVEYTASTRYPGSPEINAEMMTSMRRWDSANHVATAGEANSWIKADLGEPTLVDNVIFSVGVASPFSNYWAYLNGATLQYSDDDTTWTTLTTVTASSTSREVPIATGGITARYWRLTRAAGIIATGQFRFTINL